LFADRHDAASRLAAALGGLRGRNPLVLGIPRGGVPMARTIADRLEGEVEVVLVRKLGAPGNPEFGIGAVDDTGWAHVFGRTDLVGADAAYLAAEKEIQVGLLRARRAAYSRIKPPVDPAGRIAIVVDDGLATGATMVAALHSVRARKPQRLICAVPVAPPETVELIRRQCDELVCLEAPENFRAVGQFYRDFGQVGDAEVLDALRPAS
jgi:predicted phosphoribosyltransferase